jgi:hypothetical protein
MNARGTGLTSGALLLALLALAPSAHARYTISCESHEYRYQYCAAATQGYARLLSQNSSAACVQGRTWGYDRGGVWVNKGCSATFEVGGSAGPVPQPYPPPYPGGGRVPGWAIGSFFGTDATGAQQTVQIGGDGSVTIRYGDRRPERGSFSGNRIDLGNRSLGVQQIRGGIAIDGMAFQRR